MNTIALLFFMLICSLSYAQVGIGTEQPAYDFEVKGSVRFRNLEKKSQLTHYREVRSDDQGRLTAIQFGDVGMVFKNLVKQFVPNSIGVPVGMPQDLGVKLQVELLPFTETTIVLTYNIPIYQNASTSTIHPHFGGIQLIRKDGGTQTLYGGSRKFSFPTSFPAGSELKRGMFIDSKYVDVIKNTTDTTRIVEYSLTGFTEGPTFTVLFFGDNFSNSTSNTMGVGVFSAMIFNQYL